MTRKEAIDIIKCLAWHTRPDEEDVEQAIKALEQEPKTGHWIEEKNDYEEIIHWHCSNCYDDSGFITTCKWDFCPNCGADMRGEQV